jgi:hypothetical protein
MRRCSPPGSRMSLFSSTVRAGLASTTKRMITTTAPVTAVASKNLQTGYVKHDQQGDEEELDRKPPRECLLAEDERDAASDSKERGWRNDRDVAEAYDHLQLIECPVIPHMCPLYIEGREAEEATCPYRNRRYVQELQRSDHASHREERGQDRACPAVITPGVAEGCGLVRVCSFAFA